MINSIPTGDSSGNVTSKAIVKIDNSKTSQIVIKKTKHSTPSLNSSMNSGDGSLPSNSSLVTFAGDKV
jgi:hypothetical protein